MSDCDWPAKLSSRHNSVKRFRFKNSLACLKQIFRIIKIVRLLSCPFLRNHRNRPSVQARAIRLKLGVDGIDPADLELCLHVFSSY